MHHPILPRKPGSTVPVLSRPSDPPTEGPTPTWHRFLSKEARERIAADDISEHGKEGSTEIDRLRDMLARRTPKDVDYKQIHAQLTQAYAEAYPGSEEDNAR